jgi:hypothetical protein
MITEIERSEVVGIGFAVILLKVSNLYCTELPQLVVSRKQRIATPVRRKASSEAARKPLRDFFYGLTENRIVV